MFYWTGYNMHETNEYKFKNGEGIVYKYDGEIID